MNDAENVSCLPASAISRVLLLGGTGDALALARHMEADDIYSIAGLGKTPEGLPCRIKVGGYGGAAGLEAFLKEQGIALVIDATHPYAANISTNAQRASQAAGLPCWALRRAAWPKMPTDDWREVDGWTAIAAALADFKRPLFTLGREPLLHLDHIPAGQHWIVRCLDAGSTPPHWEAGTGRGGATIIAARGPFTLEGERQFFADSAIDVIVSKHSGGAATESKLVIAREYGLPVLMLARPTLPPVTREFASSSDLLAALRVWRTGNTMTMV